MKLPPSKSGAVLNRLAQRKLAARTPPKAGLTALVSASHLDPETEAFLATFDIAARSGLGSSVKFIAVAEGQADVYLRFAPTMEWDTAAGQAVLEQAATWSRPMARRFATARSSGAYAIRASLPGAARLDHCGEDCVFGGSSDDGLIDRIQAMIFHRSSSVLRIVPNGGIGPVTCSCCLRS